MRIDLSKSLDTKCSNLRIDVFSLLEGNWEGSGEWEVDVVLVQSEQKYPRGDPEPNCLDMQGKLGKWTK